MKLMRPISLVLLCIAFVPSLTLGQTAEREKQPSKVVEKAPETAAEKFDFWLNENKINNLQVSYNELLNKYQKMNARYMMKLKSSVKTKRFTMLLWSQ